MNDAVSAPLIGQTVTVLDTPALIVDLDVLEANIARIAGLCRDNGVNWRPHVKGNKTVEIVRKELAAGAIGITCAKVGEAEVMVAAGVRSILIANEIVGASKIARLVALQSRAEVMVGIDLGCQLCPDRRGGRAGGRDRAGRDRGEHRHESRRRRTRRAGGCTGRCGIDDEGRAARGTDDLGEPGNRNRRPGRKGTRGEGGHTRCSPPVPMPAARPAIASISSAAAAAAPCPYCAMQPGITEIEAGGAIFSDVLYRERFHLDFPPALHLLASVTSRPTPTRIILDAGKKAMSSDGAIPAPLGLAGVHRVGLSAEHATVELEAPSETPAVGDKVLFVVGYGDTTVHLHEEIAATRGGRIEAIWPVAARGRIR